MISFSVRHAKETRYTIWCGEFLLVTGKFASIDGLWVMSTTSVARWVSEEKRCRWHVFSSGVAPSASFGAMLCIENKTTHDGDRREAITLKVAGSSPVPATNNANRFRYRRKNPVTTTVSGFFYPIFSSETG